VSTRRCRGYGGRRDVELLSPSGQCPRTGDPLADRQQIVLSDEEAARFLDALEDVDEDAVTRLRDLRQRV
jgi:uncharacterized protein (DUF1778 family)